MQDAVRVLAGDCRVRGPETDLRGAVVLLAKPDGTVVVHDAGGRRPAAALAADTLAVSRDAGGFAVRARGAAGWLQVASHERYGHAHYPVSPAGPPVGECPDCGGTLVRGGGRVTCTGCLLAYSIPEGATATGARCEECGLPLVETAAGVWCPDDGCRRP